MTHYRRAASFLCVLACALTSSPSPAADNAGYEWKGGKWVPIAPPAEGTEAGHLALIRQHINRGENSKAVKSARNFLDAYPGSPAREEAMLLAGEAEMARGHYWDAFKWFRNQLSEFPSGKYYERALERQYDIGDAFLKGRKRRFLAIFRVAATEDGIDILTGIAETAPASDVAERALLRVAEHHDNAGDHDAAVDAYDQFLELHPKSPRAEQAMLAAARARYAAFRGVKYDDTPLIDAEQRFRLFTERFPAAAARENVAATLEEIRTRRAEKLYEAGRFYERTGKPGPAAYTYRQVVLEFGGTEWASMAAAKLQAMGKPMPTTRPVVIPRRVIESPPEAPTRPAGPTTQPS